jgi:hypothetical protein
MVSGRSASWSSSGMGAASVFAEPGLWGRGELAIVLSGKWI